jgi:hypothetical protein
MLTIVGETRIRAFLDHHFACAQVGLLQLNLVSRHNTAAPAEICFLAAQRDRGVAIELSSQQPDTVALA